MVATPEALRLGQHGEASWEWELAWSPCGVWGEQGLPAESLTLKPRGSAYQLCGHVCHWNRLSPSVHSYEVHSTNACLAPTLCLSGLNQVLGYRAALREVPTPSQILSGKFP